MWIWLQVAVAAAALLAAVLVGVKLADQRLRGRQKALLALFVQEFVVLVRRLANYYRQYLEGPETAVRVFEAVDSGTFTRLCEAAGSVKVIETALMLKSDFFHALRYAEQAAEALSLKAAAEAAGERALAEQAARKAAFARRMALDQFLGDLEVDGKFFRGRYHDYISNIGFLLDQLEQLNRPPRPWSLLLPVSKPMRIQKTSLDEFITHRRRELILLEEKLDLLREKELRRTAEGR